LFAVFINFIIDGDTRMWGQTNYVSEHQDKIDNELKNTTFTQGDIINTIITCANGETISIKLDTTLPRYYTREFTIRGTKGVFEQTGNIALIEGEYNHLASYEDFINSARKYENEFLPDIWKNTTEEILQAGHGGMDYYVFEAFIDALQNKKEMPIDVYDAASWMVITALSEQSILMGGNVVVIPDFTKGKWLLRPRKDVIDF
jgi:hypothetical protein